MTKEELIANANSEGLIQDYYSTSTSTVNGVLGRTPRFDTKKALALVRQDPVVRASVIKLVDKVVESGWRVKPLDGNQKSNAKAVERALREVRFDRVLRKAVFNLVMYNNVFIEIVKKGDKVTDLNVLETEFMRITAENNGDVIGYYQEVGDGRKAQKPTWTADQVCHIKLDDFTTNVWSEFNVEAIYETVLIKDYIRQWMTWFFKTNQLRPVIAMQNSNKDSVRQFLTYLKAAEQHVDKPIPIEGEITITKLQSFADEGKTILEVLNWCDSQVRQLLQVPGISMGISDGSGRSDGAEHRDYLNTRVFNIQRLLEDDMTYDLFPKMGFNRVELVFGVMDETTKTRIFDTVVKMRQAQFIPEAILEYLDTQGVTFETKNPLLSFEDIQQMSNKELGTGNEGMKGNASADAAQSRNRQDGAQVSKANRSGQVKA